jgi:hypothetical protein
MPTWLIYTSDDESAKIHIDTDRGGIVKLEDLNAETFRTLPIDKAGSTTGKDELSDELYSHPGFKFGKIAMMIARLIEKALT